MQLQEALNEPSIEYYKPILGEKYEKEVDRAMTYALLENEGNPLSRNAIISYVVSFLENIIETEIKPKRKGWKIFWNIVLLGLPVLAKKLKK